MNPLELITSLLAPHLCLVCKKEGSPLCLNCAKNCFKPPKSGCYLCQKQTPGFSVCTDCSVKSPLGHIWAGTQYSGVAKELISLLKFQRVKAAADPTAGYLTLVLPKLPVNTLVVPVPTANKRIRMRGYDQSELIAKKFARKRGLRCQSLLRRAKSTRQVGSGRKQRFAQLQDAFTVRQKVTDRPILLIDDVLTTGATLESAAGCLAKAGASHVDAAIFAFQPLKQRAPVVPKLIGNYA